MLIGAAVCPHPPLLVPEVATGAAGELDNLRAACDESVGRLVAGEPDLVVIVGGAPETYDFGSDAAGSLRPYGVDMTVGPGEPVLPLSLVIGRWLLERTLLVPRDSGSPRLRLQAVAVDAPVTECLRLGSELAAAADRVSLLVMADGSARRSEKAPGYLDDRGERFDARVADALATADAGGLAKLDAALAAELMVAGRAAWQVLAGAAGGQRFSAELLTAEAPYAVGYMVATWAGLREPGSGT